jgi:hypothetical protein
VPHSHGRGAALHLQGAARLSLGRDADAIKQFDAARQAGHGGAVYFHAYAYASRRDWANAQRVVALRKSTGSPSGELEVTREAALFALDRGHWLDALRLSQDAFDAADKLGSVYTAPENRIRLHELEWLAGKRTRAQTDAILGKAIQELGRPLPEGDQIASAYRSHRLQALAYLAARNGMTPALQDAIARVDEWKGQAGYPLIVQMQSVLRAEVTRLQGRPADAVRQLAALAKRPDALVSVRSALLRALQAAGDDAGVITQANWLASHRGKAYMDMGMSGYVQPLNVADTTLAHLDAAEAWTRLRQPGNAAKERDAFLRAWPWAQLPAPIKERLERITP